MRKNYENMEAVMKINNRVEYDSAIQMVGIGGEYVPIPLCRAEIVTGHIKIKDDNYGKDKFAGEHRPCSVQG